MDFESQGAPFLRERSSCPHLRQAPWGAPPCPDTLLGCPMGCPSSAQAPGTHRGDSKGHMGHFPELHPTRNGGRLVPAMRRGTRGCRLAPHLWPCPALSWQVCLWAATCTPCPQPWGCREGTAQRPLPGRGTSLPTEAEISSRSGSFTVKTRTPGRATQQIYSLGSGTGLGIQCQ